MADLPNDWTPPPRGIVDVRLAAPEHGGGVLIGCDCGTTTHLVIEDIEHLTAPKDAAFCCDGCQSVHWFTVDPGLQVAEPMTPEAETALIALAVTTCPAEHEVSYTGDGGGMLICSMAAGHDGIVHYDPADGLFWIPAQRGMTRDQAEAVAARIREAMAA